MVYKPSENDNPTFLFYHSDHIQNIIFSSDHLKKDILEHSQGKAGDALQNHILQEWFKTKETGDRNNSSTNIYRKFLSKTEF